MNRFAFAFLFAATTTHAAITGIVVDESGKPISGAAIRVYAAEDLRGRQARLAAGKVDLPVIASAASGENGRFGIDAKVPVATLVIDAAGQQTHVEEAGDGEDLIVVLNPKNGAKIRLLADGKPVANAMLSAGPVTLRSDADGLAERIDPTSPVTMIHPDFAPSTLPYAMPVSVPSDVVLNRGVTIRGRVVAADGSPVANATLTIAGSPVAQSSADGTFTVPHAVANWRTLAAVEGTRAGMVAQTRASSYEIHLKPAASLSGTTIPNSRVSITPNQAEPFESVIADARGTFSATALPADRYFVRVFKRGYAAANAEVVLHEGTQGTVSLSAKPLRIVTGRVVDEEKHPVAGAFVWYGPMIWQTLAMTGSNGEFSVRRLDSAARIPAVSAVKAGYANGISDAITGEKNDVTITLPRGFPLQVRVVDTQRRSVSLAFVSVVRDMSLDPESPPVEPACERPLARLCRYTGDDGTIKLRATAAAYAIAVTGESIVSKFLQPQPVDAKASPLVVEVQRGVEVSGRVLYSDRTPVADAVVTVRGIGGMSARTQPDGTFTTRNAPPGKIALVATTMQPQFASPAVEIDAPARNVLITMPIPAAVEGRVSDKETGRPIADFQIALTGRTRGRPYAPQTFRSEDGTYHIDGVPAGPVELQFAAAGHAPGTLGGLTVEEGKTLRGVDIALDLGGSVRGRVTAAGQPLSGVAVRLGDRTMQLPPQMRSLTASMSDENGDYLIDGIAEGDRVIEFSRDGFVSKRKNVDVARGKELRLDVELDRGSELQGRVTDKAGQPVQGVRVSATPLGGRPGSRPATTDASGNFTLSALSDGRYSVNAMKEGYVNARADDVTVPSTAPLTLTLDTGGTITGHIVGLSQTERASAEVSAGGKGSFARAQANADGSFVLHGIPDGRVTITAFVRGSIRMRQSVPKSIEVVNGSAPAVQIDFSEGFTVTGRVTRNGSPLSGGSVDFTGKGNRSSAIGPEGMYQVDGLVAGEFTVVVYGPSGMLYRAKYAVAGDSTYDISIAGAALRGRVLDASTGAPLSEATVATVPNRENPTMRQSVSDSEGSFTLDALTDGTYLLRAARDRYAPATQSRTVTNGGAPDIEIRLERAQPMVFRVVDAQSGAAVDAMISVSQDKKAVAQSRGVRDDDGGIPIYLAPGNYKAFVFAGGYVNQSVDFSAPGPDVCVPLSMAGRVMLIASKQTNVLIRSAGKAVRGATVSPMGTAVENLPPGAYSLEVMGATPKTVVKTIPVTVAAGQTTTVNVD